MCVSVGWSWNSGLWGPALQNSDPPEFWASNLAEFWPSWSDLGRLFFHFARILNSFGAFDLPEFWSALQALLRPQRTAHLAPRARCHGLLNVHRHRLVKATTAGERTIHATVVFSRFASTVFADVGATLDSKSITGDTGKVLKV